MHINLFKKLSTVHHKKDGRINPHRFWIFFMAGFLVVLTCSILWSTYFFIQTVRTLDTAVAPRRETNSVQVTAIEQSIQKTESAVSTRTGAVQ